jgi:hypothetical protein
VSKYTLGFSKPVTLTGDWNYGHPELRAAQHRAIKTRRQAIRRRLRRKIPRKEREELTCELQDLALIETQLFGVRHRETQLPLGKDGKPYVPKTARGKLHLPITALPLDTRGRPHVPSAREIVATAVFQKFVEKGNLPMAMAKLAQIDPMAARQVQMEAKNNPNVRRALNRLGSDVKAEWPPKPDELLVLENFYATKILPRPLYGLADYDAVVMLNEKDINMNVDRYRRILRKFQAGLGLK